MWYLGAYFIEILLSVGVGNVAWYPGIQYMRYTYTNLARMDVPK